MASQITANGTCQQCTKVTCPSCHQERVHSEFGKHATCQRCRTISCPCCNLERMPCEFNAGGADQRCVHCQAVRLQCASCNELKPKISFTATQIALGSNRRCIHCSQKQKKPTKRSLQDALQCFSCGIERLRADFTKSQWKLGTEKRCSPCVASKSFNQLDKHEKGKEQLSRKGLNEKQTTNIRPQATTSDDEEYALPPRKKRHAIHQDESTGDQPKFFTNDDEEHVSHAKLVQKNQAKKRPHDDLQPKSPHKRKPQKNQDTASSSHMTKVQCLLDLPIASYSAMYEYLDKNNFEVGMQLLGATNKANIRKQYLHLSVKLHPDKDQTNVHATERFALLLRTYEMLQKMP